MLKCRAIQKVTNKHGQTVGYILQDGTGKTMSVATENIKYAIHNGQADIINLKIASNGKLIMVDAIPENFIKVADIIAKEAGVEHTEPTIKNKTALIQFKNTPYYLVSDLLGNIIKICDTSGKNYVINSIDMTHRVAGIIRANLLSSGAINKIVIKFSEYLVAVYGEKELPENDEAARRYADLVGVTLTTEGISVQNKNIDLEIVYDCTDEWIRNFIDTHCIISSINLLTVSNSLCNSITIRETSTDKNKHKFETHTLNMRSISQHKFIVLNNCVCNNILIDDLTINFVTIDQCYVENMLKSTGLKEIKFIVGFSYINKIDIDDIKDLSDFRVISNQCRIKCNEAYLHLYWYYNNCMAAKEIYIESRSSLLFGVSNFASKHIKIKAEEIALTLDNKLDSAENKVEMALNSTTNEYVRNKFNTDFKDMFSWQTYLELDENAKIKWSKSAFAGTCNRKTNVDDIHRRVGDSVDTFFSANMLSEPSDNFNMYYGVVLQEGEHLEFNNLIATPGLGIKNNVGKCNINGNKGFILLNSVDNVSDISITIKGDIIPAKKRSGEVDRNALINNLANLIKHNVKVKVAFNSVVYNRLKSCGVDVEIIDADKHSDELEKLKRTAMKENMLGKSIMDVILNNIEYAEGIGLDGDYVGLSEFPINTNYNIEIPDEIIDYFGLTMYATNVEEAESCDIQTYTFIELLKQLPTSNLPFTKDALMILSSDSNIKMKAESHPMWQDGISLHHIYIGYTNSKKIDKYMALTNGKKLIYMGYVGNSEIEMSSRQVTKLNHGALALIGTNELTKLDKIDFANREINQHLTSNTSKLPKLLKETSNFIDKYMNMLYNIDSKIILTLACGKGEENNIERFRVQAFKANIKSSRNDIFNSLVHTDISMESLFSLETMDSDEGLKQFINTINSQYRDSILYNAVLAQRNSNTEDNEANADSIFEIPAAEVSSLWQFAMTFGNFNENPYQKMSKQQVEMMINLPTFNEIDKSDYDDIKAKFDWRQNYYGEDLGTLLNVTESGVKIIEHRIDGKSVNRLKKYKTDYMECCMEVVEYIDESTGEKRYFVYDDTIMSLLSNCRNIQTRHNRFSGTGEQFLKFMSDEDLIYQPYRAEHEYNEIYSKLRSFCWENKIDTWREREEREKQISALTQDKQDEYYKLNRHYESEKKIKDKMDIFYIIGRSVMWTYGNGSRKNSPDGVQTLVTLDCTTGYIYMIVFTGRHFIPICRLQNYRKACEILNQMHREDKNEEGISVALAAADCKLFDLVTLQVDNIRDLREYRKRSNNNSFTSIMSYMPDKEILESFGNNTQVNLANTDKVISEMPNFNYNYLTYYINNGAVKEIQKILTGYTKINSYKAPGASCNIIIDEYYSNDNNNYIYVIDKSLKILSDFKLSELMDLS